MRKLSLLALIISSLVLGGCSFSTDLAVVNLSDKPIEVRYRVKDFPGPFSPPVQPAIKTRAEMDDDTPWRDIDGYVVDSHSRTIRVTLDPGTALLIDRVRGPGIATDADSFRINEIVVRGAYGTMMLHGEQVQKSFAPESNSKRVYSVTYK